MKLQDILHLSWKNLTTHRKQSWKIMLVMGALLTLIFAIQFWFQGVKNTYQNFATSATNGKVILIVSTDLSTITGEESPAEISTTAMFQDVENFGGQILGKAKTYGNYGYLVLNQSLVQNLIEIDLSTTPENAIPILIATHDGESLAKLSFSDRTVRTPTLRLESYDKYRRTVLGQTFTTYHIVGLAQTNYHLSSLATSGVNTGRISWLDATLQFITTASSPSIAVLDDQEWENNLTTLPNTYIAMFDNAEQAYEYFQAGKALFPNTSFENRTYQARPIMGLSPEVMYIFQGEQIIINVICIILFIIAIIVIVFTTIRLVDSDQTNIKLYYNLGATAKQIRAVYFAYFLELAFGAIIIALTLATIIVLLYSWFNQQLLQATFITAFSLTETPSIILWGISLEIIGFVVLTFLTTIFSVFINRKRLNRPSIKTS